MRTEFTAQPHFQKPSFKALNKIDKTALKIAGNAIFDARDTLSKHCEDVNVEIIGKRGLLTKIKSLIIFVTNKGEKGGEWASVSIDPKGYMPTEHRYKTVKEFKSQDIIEALDGAKARLKKHNLHLPKPSLPVDIVILKPLVEKFNKGCKV